MKNEKSEVFTLRTFLCKTLNSRYNQPMSVQNLEINKANLLNAVVSLPKNEFESLIANAKKLRKKYLKANKTEKLN